MVISRRVSLNAGWMLAGAGALSAPAFGAQEALFLPLERVHPGDFGCGQALIGVLRTELLEAGFEEGLGLELPGGGAVVLEGARAETAWGGGVVWTLSVAGDPHGSATLSCIGDVAIGSIRVDERLFALEWSGRGLHALREIDEVALPVCGTSQAHAVLGGASEAPASASSSAVAAGMTQRATGGAPPTIDVLVVYTAAARTAEGGVAAIEAKVNLAIAETNQAYANSQVLQRVRLVHQSELLGYVEDPSFNTMLSQLRNPSDGVIDEVHGLRDQYGADMVAMIVTGTQYCGIAYLMQNPSTGFEDRAFSVTARQCATGNYTFGHELGHNMGCHHDRANASSGAYPYSYGYRTANGQWRTIMAYAPGTRVQYFSNPNVSYSGQPLGIAEPAPDSAENWKSLNNTAAIVARFRCAVPAPYGVSKTTSIDSTPVLTCLGSPSVAAGSVPLRLEQAVPDRPSVAFFGLNQGSAPWNGGALYVAGPKTRLGVQQLDANGAATFTLPLGACTPGDVLFCQGWFRDPAVSDGTTIGLTHGLRIDVCP